MKVLGIESSSLVASAALLDDEIVIAEYTVDHKKTHSQTLLPMIDEISRMLGQDLADVDVIAAAAGPGSFTGLRIGAATAKGLALAWGKPVAAVPTLDAMAYGLFGYRGLVCPIMDAKRGQAYTALYEFDENDRMETLIPAAATDMKEMLAAIRIFELPVMFLGDGIPVFRKLITDTLGDTARFAPPHLSRQKASSVAAFGLLMAREGKVVSAAEFAPDYFRVSQAERERNARLKAEKAAGEETPSGGEKG